MILGYAIETHQLTKRFRRALGWRRLGNAPEFTAVDHLDLQVEQGEVFGLLGPNGAGKTTLVKMLCTLIWPTSGTARVNGYDTRNQEQMVRGAVGLVVCDERSFYWRLTAWQNLRFYATLCQLSKQEAEKRIAEALDLLDLRQYVHTRFQEYSTGMKQKLAIARGLLTQPQVLFMDEPTRSLDPLSAQGLRHFIKERIVREARRTVILATHQMGEVEQLCDRVAVLNHGRLATCGTVAELRARFRRSDRYLLEIKDLDHSHLARLHQVPGLLDWKTIFTGDGMVTLEVDIAQGQLGLPELLHFVMQNGGKICRCSLEEAPLEEVFASIISESSHSSALEKVTC
jgi:ABC-2 type transport system ATP-binding protein